MFSNKTPLAWLNLTHNKRRLFLSVIGVTFAVVIMFVEVGFYLTFYDSNTTLIRKFNANLIMLNKTQQSLALSQAQTFPRTRIYQAQNIAGITDAYPMYMERKKSLWRNEKQQSRSIRVIAFDINQPALRIPEIYSYQRLLKLPGNVIIDSKTRKNYAPFSLGTKTEFAKKNAQVVGHFELGLDFANHGNIIMSAENFSHFFQQNNRESIRERVSLALLKVAPGFDLIQVQESLQQFLPNDVRVFTVAELIEWEKAFWRKTSPVGPIFLMGTVAGFIVGIIICYQILYSNVMNYLKQFATLKAFGFTNSYLRSVVLQEAIFLSLLGFAVAFAATKFITKAIAESSSIQVNIDISTTTIILVLTIAMCIIAGTAAAKKAFLADPADLF